MPDHKIIQEWLSKADEDRAFAETCLNEEISFFAQICFFFQQAAEKYLKTYLVSKELKFRKTHDLIELLTICENQNPSFSELKDACKFVNRFYIDTRYPVHWPSDFTQDDALKAKTFTQQIAQSVKNKL